MTLYFSATHWLMPASYETFMALRRHGSAFFWLPHCLPIAPDWSPRDLDPKDLSLLMGSLPEYEDDYQMMILESGPLEPERVGQPWGLRLLLSSLRRVIPLSQRGSQRLQGLLPDVPLSEPCLAEAFHLEDRRRNLEKARMGARAFVRLLGLSPDHLEAQQRMKEIEFSWQRKEDEEEPKSFLDRLLRYSREIKAPKNDLGFFMDLGILIRQGTGKTDTLDRYRELVKERTDSTSDMKELLLHFSSLRKDLSGLTDTWYPSSVIYLKLKREIQDSGGLWRELDAWTRVLMEKEPESVAEAALLAGYAFEFQSQGDRFWNAFVKPELERALTKPPISQVTPPEPPTSPAPTGLGEDPSPASPPPIQTQKDEVVPQVKVEETSSPPPPPAPPAKGKSRPNKGRKSQESPGQSHLFTGAVSPPQITLPKDQAGQPPPGAIDSQKDI